MAHQSGTPDLHSAHRAPAGITAAKGGTVPAADRREPRASSFHGGRVTDFRTAAWRRRDSAPGQFPGMATLGTTPPCCMGKTRLAGRQT